MLLLGFLSFINPAVVFQSNGLVAINPLLHA